MAAVSAMCGAPSSPYLRLASLLPPTCSSSAVSGLFGRSSFGASACDAPPYAEFVLARMHVLERYAIRPEEDAAERVGEVLVQPEAVAAMARVPLDGEGRDAVLVALVSGSVRLLACDEATGKLTDIGPPCDAVRDAVRVEEAAGPTTLIPSSHAAFTDARTFKLGQPFGERTRVCAAALYDGLVHILLIPPDHQRIHIAAANTFDAVAWTRPQRVSVDDPPPAVLSLSLLHGGTDSGFDVGGAILVALLVEEQGLHAGLRSVHCACVDLDFMGVTVNVVATMRAGPWAVANVHPSTSLVHELQPAETDGERRVIALSAAGIAVCPRYAAAATAAAATSPMMHASMGGTLSWDAAQPTCCAQTPSCGGLVVGDASGSIRVVELRGGIADPTQWLCRKVDGTFSPPRTLLLLDGGAASDAAMVLVASVDGDSQLLLSSRDGDHDARQGTDFLREWTFPGAAVDLPQEAADDAMMQGALRVETHNGAVASGASFLRSLAPVRDATCLPIAASVPTSAICAADSEPEYHALACCGTGPAARLVRMHVGAELVTEVVDGPPAKGVERLLACPGEPGSPSWLAFSWEEDSTARTDVMAVSEEGMVAIDVPGVETGAATLALRRIAGDDTVVQVVRGALRAITAGVVTEWHAPDGARIAAAAVADDGTCALACGEAMYIVAAGASGIKEIAKTPLPSEVAALAVNDGVVATGFWVRNDVRVGASADGAAVGATIALAPEQPRTLFVARSGSDAVDVCIGTSAGSVLLSRLPWPIVEGSHLPQRRVCVGVTATRLLGLGVRAENEPLSVLASCDEGAALLAQDGATWSATRVGGWPGARLIGALGSDRFAWVEPVESRMQVGHLDRTKCLRFTTHRLGTGASLVAPLFAAFHATSGCAVVVTAARDGRHALRLVHVADGGLGRLADAHEVVLEAGLVPTCVCCGNLAHTVGNGTGEYILLGSYGPSPLAATAAASAVEPEAVQGLLGVYAVDSGDGATPRLRLLGARPIPSVAFAACVESSRGAVVLGCHDGVVALDVTVDVDGAAMEEQLERALKLVAAPLPPLGLAEDGGPRVGAPAPDADDETMHDPLSVRIIGTATDVRGVVQLAEVPGDGGRLVATKLFAPLAVIELRGADASDPLRVTHASTPRDDAEGAPVPLAAPYGTCVLPAADGRPPLMLLTGHPRGVAVAALVMDGGSSDDAPEPELRTIAAASPPDFFPHVLPVDIGLRVSGDRSARAHALLLGTSGWAAHAHVTPGAARAEVAWSTDVNL